MEVSPLSVQSLLSRAARRALVGSVLLPITYAAVAYGAPSDLLVPAAPLALPTGVTQTSGTLSAQSARISGKPTDLYAIQLGANETVEIVMNGSFDTYLRLEGPGVNQTDDDGGEGNNARLVATAAAEGGAYRIHAMGYNSEALGAYTLIIRRFTISQEPRPAPVGVEGVPGMRQGVRRAVVSASLTHTGTLTAQSAQLDGKPFDSYTIELSPNEQIDLSMNANFDTFLKLEGPGVDQSDDDGGEGNNARIIASVTGGRYTIHAMGYNLEAIGEYELKLYRFAPEGELIRHRGTLSASSQRGSDGKFYEVHSIAVNAGEHLIMNLRGNFDPFLRVSGGGSAWEDDDSGEGNNAYLIASPTEAGELAIQATAYQAEASGEYQLSIQKARLISGGSLTPAAAPASAPPAQAPAKGR